MSKAQELEDMQEFIDEYERLKDNLEELLDDTNNKELKEEINGLITILEEDYAEQNQDFIERIKKLEDEEETFYERTFYATRL